MSVKYNCMSRFRIKFEPIMLNSFQISIFVQNLTERFERFLCKLVQREHTLNWIANLQWPLLYLSYLRGTKSIISFLFGSYKSPCINTTYLGVWALHYSWIMSFWSFPFCCKLLRRVICKPFIISSTFLYTNRHLRT